MSWHIQSGISVSVMVLAMMPSLYPRSVSARRDVFFENLTKNWKAYRKWAKDTLLDVSEMELWLQYLLPDCPAERIAPNAARPVGALPSRSAVPASSKRIILP